ncbi:muscle M-line assembly protein unc-89 isoform X2 [Bicyclus anynana]|uniref:Muscle M-line assembly protein unc-89 isoform X2 n=1 Tax=Bicyclus anynana TaxID=110368 RepID=A0A6J1NJF1_BICAN|nr:muscle M-line assembly protein unc-89 isoform X2 [Bicyclus anynana]
MNYCFGSKTPRRSEFRQQQLLPQPGVPHGGQASPAKGNVASANHAGALPQGANSLHAPNSVNVQNLSQHAPGAPPPSHAAPSMAPVSANMAQMAQNMSHHGNLSLAPHPAAPAPAASPSKSASTSAPLSLVQDKVPVSQPLALTRTPEKKEPDSTGQANGTVESPKSASNAPAMLKPQNPEPKQEKQDIAKTSPSTPKPPEKPASTPGTPQKPEATLPVSQTDGPAQPKVATANEPPEKSPSKPTEPKPAPTADVAPSQSDSKPVPESANECQSQEKPPSPLKPEKSAEESAKPEPSPEKEDKKDEVKEEPVKIDPQPLKTEKAEPEKVEPAKQEEPDKPQKDEPVEEKKPDTKPLSKAALKVTPKSTLKLATVTPPMRKRRQVTEKLEGATPSKKPAEEAGTPDTRTKRNRTKVQLYQSPTPEIAMATKLSASAGRATPTKPNDDKLIVFYKNEYLAVRNAEGGFYVCQAVQNVYRSTRKIKIRWLSQDKADSSGETYKPDFYDVTDMECVLTTLSLSRASGGAQVLKAGERARVQSILQRALRAEQSGANHLQLTEEHPDGLDLSLYTDESQLEKKASRKRNSSKSSPKAEADDSETAKSEATPSKKARTTPKRSPKSVSKAPAAAPARPKGAGSSPAGATSKTATALTEKAKAKTPTKRTPAKPTKVETPVSTPRKGRRAAKENKSTPVVPTPSTSTGKTGRTRRSLKK